MCGDCKLRVALLTVSVDCMWTDTDLLLLLLLLLPSLPYFNIACTAGFDIGLIRKFQSFLSFK